MFALTRERRDTRVTQLWQLGLIWRWLKMAEVTSEEYVEEVRTEEKTQVIVCRASSYMPESEQLKVNKALKLAQQGYKDHKIHKYPGRYKKLSKGSRDLKG